MTGRSVNVGLIPSSGTGASSPINLRVWFFFCWFDVLILVFGIFDIVFKRNRNRDICRVFLLSVVNVVVLVYGCTMALN